MAWWLNKSGSSSYKSWDEQQEIKVYEGFFAFSHETILMNPKKLGFSQIFSPFWSNSTDDGKNPWVLSIMLWSKRPEKPGVSLGNENPEHVHEG